MRLFGWVGSMLLLCACGGAGPHVRGAASADFHCAVEDIGLAHTGGGEYRAMGCGQRAEYVCTAGGEVRYSCVRSGDIEVDDASAARSAPDGPNGRLCFEIAECVGSEDVRITYAGGRVTGLSVGDNSPGPQRACVARAAAAYPIQGGSVRCPRVPTETIEPLTESAL